MNRKKTYGGHVLSIIVGIMVSGLLVVGGMGAVENKTFEGNDLFTISALKSSIAVTVPNGDENWQAGTTKKIKWKYTGNPGSRVNIELLNGTKISTINSNVPIGRKGNGSYKWLDNSTQQPGTNYEISITSKSNPIYKDKSNKNFTILPAKSNGTIKIASFNLQIFGVTKAGKSEVMDVLSKTIRNFDIVAVQEIRDASQTALPALRNVVNSIDGPQYDYIVGERLGRTTSKEQYAYLYNTQKIELIGTPYTYPEPAGNDMFHREPYVSEFKAKNGHFDFVLINIHTDPDTTTQEINDLPKVVDDAKGRYQGEEDFIVMGDLNADCGYFDEDGSSLLKSSDYLWVINNSIDTTTKATNCTYDRIILTSQATSDFTGNSGLFRFDEAYNLNYDSTIAVSDHYPVYAEFWSK
jgi:endonuclease/exonuclease/phosphatase family metal-dependent hydrolase